MDDKQALGSWNGRHSDLWENWWCDNGFIFCLWILKSLEHPVEVVCHCSSAEMGGLNIWNLK